MADIVELLRVIQGDKTDMEFSDLLGIDNSSWSRVKRGERPASKKLLKGAIKNYPYLEKAAEEYYLNQGLRERSATQLATY
jgi:hypothetical protein